MLSYFFIFSIVIGTILSAPAYEKQAGSPVILVPGDGGSQFEARLNKTKTVHSFCDKTTKGKFEPLWLSLESLAPYMLDCLVDNMRLIYDKKTRTTQNNEGVEIRQVDFGNTTGIEYLDASPMPGTSYFYEIVLSLVNLGYKKGINVRGAPYDFRKAPNEMQDFIKKLVELVEDTYKINNNQKVVLVGHSMGNPYLLYLLNGQSRAWKDKYVKSFVSLAAPWGGAVKPLRLMASGDNLGVFVVNAHKARLEQRSMPSTAWLMPYDTFWNDSEVLVTSPNRTYTVKDYKQFFEDIEHPEGMMMWEDTVHLGLDKLAAPEVEVHCVHGVDVKTPAGFTYTTKGNWYDYYPTVQNGDGDGTVNLRSLHGCLRWVDKNGGKKVLHKTLEKESHMGILDNKDAIEYLKQVVYN